MAEVTLEQEVQQTVITGPTRENLIGLIACASIGIVSPAEFYRGHRGSPRLVVIEDVLDQVTLTMQDMPQADRTDRTPMLPEEYKEANEAYQPYLDILNLATEAVRLTRKAKVKGKRPWGQHNKPPHVDKIRELKGRVYEAKAPYNARLKLWEEQSREKKEGFRQRIGRARNMLKRAKEGDSRIYDFDYGRCCQGTYRVIQEGLEAGKEDIIELAAKQLGVEASSLEIRLGIGQAEEKTQKTLLDIISVCSQIEQDLVSYRKRESGIKSKRNFLDYARQVYIEAAAAPDIGQPQRLLDMAEELRKEREICKKDGLLRDEDVGELDVKNTGLLGEIARVRVELTEFQTMMASRPDKSHLLDALGAIEQLETLGRSFEKYQRGLREAQSVFARGEFSIPQVSLNLPQAIAATEKCLETLADYEATQARYLKTIPDTNMIQKEEEAVRASYDAACAALARRAQEYKDIKIETYDQLQQERLRLEKLLNSIYSARQVQLRGVITPQRVISGDDSSDLGNLKNAMVIAEEILPKSKDAASSAAYYVRQFGEFMRYAISDSRSSTQTSIFRSDVDEARWAKENFEREMAPSSAHIDLGKIDPRLHPFYQKALAVPSISLDPELVKEFERFQEIIAASRSSSSGW